METLTLNRVGRVRKVREGGRDYLVAPLTLIVPGVLNGSRGALYYPPEQIANSVKIWNGCPLVVYHPTHNGKNVSARHPGVWDRSGVGQVRNPRISKGKLVAEGWFDAERARRVDPRVYNALMNNERMEISTGLYTVNVPAPAGSVCPVGRPYTHVATDYRADHLAILPDQVGACSLSDGCGLMVANRRTAPPRLPPPFPATTGPQVPGAPPRDNWGLSWQPLRNAYNPDQERDNLGRWSKGAPRPMDAVTRRRVARQALTRAASAAQRFLNVYAPAREANYTRNAVAFVRQAAEDGDEANGLRALNAAYSALQHWWGPVDHDLEETLVPSDEDHNVMNLLSDALDEVAQARQRLHDLRRNDITDWQVID